MGIENLDKIFQPNSIAVVGASERKGNIGAALMRNLIEGVFPGDIFPINPKHSKIWGKSACPTITDLKTAVDLAIIASPIISAPQIVKECAAADLGGAVIISAGGKEIGAAGKKVEAAIRKEADASGLRIIGPNCVGIISSVSKRNPIDMLGDSSPESYRKVVEICLDAKEVNGILIISAPQALTDTAEVAASLIDLLKNKSFPIFTSWVGGTDMQKGREIFNQAGIPTFDTPERAVRAFMDLYRDSQNIQVLQQIPSRLPKRLEFDRETAKNLIQKGLKTENHLLTEPEAKALLSSYGIPVIRMEEAATREEAIQKAIDIGFPVVMKINSRDITHKSDAKFYSLLFTSTFIKTANPRRII